ncbi:MAG: hypothetical protein KKB21_04155 [Nanoarchaeota archaeon]|nr:hypothetical protein [Nanoarchaeota archaeon]
MKKQILITLIFASLIVLMGVSLVSALNIEDVSVNPQGVAPGKSVEVRITLENSLEDDVSDVEVSLDLKSVPFAPERTSEAFFDEIVSDKSKDAIFKLNVNADAESGTYKIPLAVSYKIDNITKTKSTFISITINGKPKLSLASDNYLLIGRNKLTIKITNSGIAKARFLELDVLAAGGFNLLSPSRVYIGDLNSDDFDSFSFDVYATNPGTTIVPIEVRYKDFENNDYAENFDVPVRIYSQEEALSLGLVQKSNTGAYVGLIIFVIILYIIYRKLKKWLKNRKKNNKEMGK